MKKPTFTAVLLLLVFLSAFPLSAERSESVQKVLDSSFALKEQEAVIASLVSGATKQALPKDKKQILALLADYEERLGLSVSASAHYSEAAFADNSARDDTLLLDAARCALISNDVQRADGLVRSVLLTCFDDTILLRARVYAGWIQLSVGDRSGGALSLLRTYSKNASFSAFAPSLLFTLWWADNDQEARSLLLSTYPRSPEAAIIRGEINLSPAPFWFLMSRNDSLVASFAKEGSGAVEPSVAFVPSASTSDILPSVSPAVVSKTTDEAKSYQQVGFFRVKEYAEELSSQLKKKGFAPIIRSETRPSGTVYLSVLVPEDVLRSVGPRLKDAGFESYLIVE